MIFYNIYTRTQRSIVSPLYDRFAYLALDYHAIFDENLFFFPSLFLVTDEMKLHPRQERIIMLTIFRLAIRVLPDHMNIYKKRRFASQLSQGNECVTKDGQLKEV